MLFTKPIAKEMPLLANNPSAMFIQCPAAFFMLEKAFYQRLMLIS